MHIWRLEFSPILWKWAQAQSDQMCLWMAIFRSGHRFLIVFRSGLWLGHSKMWLCFGWNYFIVQLAPCSGWLSCCKVNLLLIITWIVHTCPECNILIFHLTASKMQWKIRKSACTQLFSSAQPLTPLKPRVIPETVWHMCILSDFYSSLLCVIT